MLGLNSKLPLVQLIVGFSPSLCTFARPARGHVAYGNIVCLLNWIASSNKCVVPRAVPRALFASHAGDGSCACVGIIVSARQVARVGRSAAHALEHIVVITLRRVQCCNRACFERCFILYEGALVNTREQCTFHTQIPHRSTQLDCFSLCALVALPSCVRLCGCKNRIHNRNASTAHLHVGSLDTAAKNNWSHRSIAVTLAGQRYCVCVCVSVAISTTCSRMQCSAKGDDTEWTAVTKFAGRTTANSNQHCAHTPRSNNTHTHTRVPSMEPIKMLRQISHVSPFYLVNEN